MSNTSWSAPSLLPLLQLVSVTDELFGADAVSAASRDARRRFFFSDSRLSVSHKTESDTVGSGGTSDSGRLQCEEQ